jgi:hypothetical protein
MDYIIVAYSRVRCCIQNSLHRVSTECIYSWSPSLYYVISSHVCGVMIEFGGCQIGRLGVRLITQATTTLEV